MITKDSKKEKSEIHFTALYKDLLWSRSWDSRSKEENHYSRLSPCCHRPHVSMVQTQYVQTDTATQSPKTVRGTRKKMKTSSGTAGGVGQYKQPGDTVPGNHE